MLRVLLFIVLAALPLYAFIDCAMKDDTQIKRLPKWGWLLIILFTQALGAIAYLVAGRNRGNGGGFKKGPKRRILPPDDDPDFLRKL
jgi:hypothetical protein